MKQDPLFVTSIKVLSDTGKMTIIARLSNGLSLSCGSEACDLGDLDAVRDISAEQLKKIWDFIDGYNLLYELNVRNGGAS